jgi:hypothetical protein
VNTNREQLLETAGLRVRFCWRGDRYAHEIWLPHGADWICALSSVEGSPQDDWPASPPLQSLEVDQREDGRTVALLVGMAGNSHWSASAQIDPELPGVRFDVACRVRDGQAGPLGSAYQANADCFPDDALEIEPGHPFAPAHLEREGGLIKIVVAASSGAAARTIRWRYRLCPTSRLP